MKKKLLLLVNIALGSVLIGLITYCEIILPRIPLDELRNYRGWLTTINEGQVTKVERLAHNIEVNSGHSQAPEVREAYLDSKNVHKALTATHDLMENASVNCSDADLWQKDFVAAHAIVTAAVAKNDELHFQSAAEYLKDIENKNLTGDMVAIELQGIQWNLIQILNYELFELSKYTTVIPIFDDFSFTPRAKKSAWIKGIIAFNTPRTMRLNEKVRLQIRFSKKFEEEMLQTLKVSDEQFADSLTVSDVMIVKLIGDDFFITAFDDDEQAVTDDSYTQWEFDVTPKTGGTHELIVKAGIGYNVPGVGNKRKYFPAYEKKIAVEVSSWEIVAGFAANRWEFLVSTFLILFFVWGYSRVRRNFKRRLTDVAEK